MTSTPDNPSIIYDDEASRYLIAHGDDDEASTSDFWHEHKKLFNVRHDGGVDGHQVLGNVHSDRSLLRDAVHRVLQFSLKRYARQYPPLAQCERLGREIARRRGQPFNYDTLRHVFTLALIKTHRNEATRAGNALVIGDGFATMSSLLLADSPDIRVCLANLTKSLALDFIYLRRAFPDMRMALVFDEDGMKTALADDTLRVIAVQADNCRLLGSVPIGLAVNIVSMQEMDLSVVNGYFDILRGNPAPSTYFYCCNRRSKVSNFEEYPWRSGDRILEDGFCEWSQNYYSARPPFLHKRAYDERAFLHRLVELEKDNG